MLPLSTPQNEDEENNFAYPYQLPSVRCAVPLVYSKEQPTYRAGTHFLLYKYHIREFTFGGIYIKAVYCMQRMQWSIKILHTRAFGSIIISLTIHSRELYPNSTEIHDDTTLDAN